jgi:hypothetical protein
MLKDFPYCDVFRKLRLIMENPSVSFSLAYAPERGRGVVWSHNVDVRAQSDLE